MEKRNRRTYILCFQMDQPLVRKSKQKNTINPPSNLSCKVPNEAFIFPSDVFSDSFTLKRGLKLVIAHFTGAQKKRTTNACSLKLR